MKAIVLRHGAYDIQSGDLTSKGQEMAIQRWKSLITSLGFPTKASDILLVSSSAPRATQTTQLIRHGMELPPDHPIHETEHLWEDDRHHGDIRAAIAFANTLPPALLLVAVTHLDVIDGFARWLWYDGVPIRNPATLYGTEIFQREIFWERPTVTAQINADPGEIYHVYLKVRELSQSSGSWELVQDEGGTTYRFHVPTIRTMSDWNPYIESQNPPPEYYEIEIIHYLRPEIDLPQGRIGEFPETSAESALEWMLKRLCGAHISYWPTKK